MAAVRVEAFVAPASENLHNNNKPTSGVCSSDFCLTPQSRFADVYASICATESRS